MFQICQLFLNNPCVYFLNPRCHENHQEKIKSTFSLNLTDSSHSTLISRHRAHITATSDVTYDVVRQDRNVKLTQKLQDLLNYTVYYIS